MSTKFSSLSILPPDALLGLMAAYKSDPRETKFDLSVGVYRDSNGVTPVMSAVKNAELRYLNDQTTKVYEGPRGNADFCDSIENVILGDNSLVREEGRTLSFTTPGGCGALYVGMNLMSRLGIRKIWVSSPTWPNHINIAKSSGFDVGEYRYASSETGGVDREAMFEDFSQIKKGDGVIIQGPCHNPTGMDLSVDDWRALGQLSKDVGFAVMLDIAYHGLGEGLDEDMEGVRAFIEAADDVMIAYSCSKNFGLYRERVGCFLAICEEASSVASVSSQVADVSRAAWSMPPAHGAAIVATILSNNGLREIWEAELSQMRGRIQGLRQEFSEKLVLKTGNETFQHLTTQKGMFSQLPFDAEATHHLREAYGVYMPASGRVNIAGLDSKEIEHISDYLARVFIESEASRNE